MPQGQFHELHADDARQADIDLRLADTGARLPDPKIAQERDLEARARSHAVDCPDTRLVEVANGIVVAAKIRHPGSAGPFVQTSGLGKIVAGAKCLVSCTSDDDSANGRIVVHRRKRCDHLASHAGMTGIARFGPVQRDDSDTAFVVNVNELHALSGWIAVPISGSTSSSSGLRASVPSYRGHRSPPARHQHGEHAGLAWTRQLRRHPSLRPVRRDITSPQGS